MCGKFAAKLQLYSCPAAWLTAEELPEYACCTAGNQGKFDFSNSGEVTGCFVPRAAALGMQCPVTSGYLCGCERWDAPLTWVSKSDAQTKCARAATYQESAAVARTICRVRQTTDNTLQYYFGRVENNLCVISNMEPEVLGSACTRKAVAGYDVLCARGVCLPGI